MCQNCNELRERVAALEKQVATLTVQVLKIAGPEKVLPELVDQVGEIMAADVRATGEPFPINPNVAQTLRHPDFGSLSDEDKVEAVALAYDGMPLEHPTIDDGDAEPA